MSLEISCNHCGNRQQYSNRSKKIPKRPKTQCKNCEKWIYIDKNLLIKNDQNQLTKFDQISLTKNDRMTKKQSLKSQKNIVIESGNVQSIKTTQKQLTKTDQKNLTKDDQMTKRQLTKTDQKHQTKRPKLNFSDQKSGSSGPKILTVNSIWAEIIEFTANKGGKGYERINKILRSHDKNRNYQSNIIRDSLEILIEMGRVR